MSCEPRQRTFIPCPATVEEHHAVVVNLLPQGYAWDAKNRPGSVMFGFFRAVARTCKWFTDEVCRAADEFFCSTRNVLAPDYDIEYGLPQPCSPFLSPCDIQPIDSAGCEDLIILLAKMGWDVECDVDDTNWSSGCAACGCAASSGEITPKRLRFIVHTSTSPIYTPSASAASGLAGTGCSISGCENTTVGTIPGLRCVIDAFLPAHLGYQVITEP